MADVEKRYFAKPWITHDDANMIKNRFYDSHLPRIKPVGEQGVTDKHALPRQSKRRGSTYFPPIARGASSGSILTNLPLASSTTNTETTPSTILYNSSVHEAAQRYILRNNMAKFSQESSSIYVTNRFHARRTTLYNHIQAKIDTGLLRTDSLQPIEFETHQLEPTRPISWSLLKQEIEQDIHICTHTKQIQFNSGTKYTTQLSTLGNLVRSKVKSYLSSSKDGSYERYKIVVHLTVFPTTTTTALHITSRCLWDTRTDNSITIKMRGVDCDVIIVVFLCYTALGTI